MGVARGRGDHYSDFPSVIRYFDPTADQGDGVSTFSQIAPVWPASLTRLPAREVNPRILIIGARGGRWP